MMPETCPNCGSPRMMFSEGRSYYRCGTSGDGVRIKFTCSVPDTKAAQPFIPKPRFIFEAGSVRCEVTGPDGRVYEFSGVRKDPVGFGEKK